MSDQNSPYTALARMLLRTREHELDCDEFLTLLAPYLDGRVEDADVRKLIEHHRDLCAECAEELRFLERSLEEPE